ncbi:MAG: M15 family metallopeptidase [Propionicimonas sp.]|uniref:M15 family metallopeptidase n=1 Tax=Propionicimonas sp. TaxID=1955623 RepID=UPI002B1F506B|nr:M15 family metallopeptidase [Propionicimonas sp.]MEA4945861.1 M15 family metallopeptidase [Propionicimonas sp.]
MNQRGACWIAGLAAMAVIGSNLPFAHAEDGSSSSPSPTPSQTASPSPIPSAEELVAARPVVKGIRKVGHQLTASTPGWSAGATFSYQWLRNGKPIRGASGATYWLVKADQGTKVSVAVTGGLTGAASRTETSLAVKITDGKTGKKLTKPFVVKGVWVINKDHRVAKKYLKKGPGVLGSKKEASKALVKLQKAAKRAGYTIQPTSGYRSYSLQTTIWKRNIRILGKKRGEQMAAPPGASEHNAGLAFDLRSGSKRGYAFGRSNAGKWVAKNAWKYGFILRYPKGKTAITGFAYEPWHFRYVGVENARAFAGTKKLTLEEYLGLA